VVKKSKANFWEISNKFIYLAAVIVVVFAILVAIQDPVGEAPLPALPWEEEFGQFQIPSGFGETPVEPIKEEEGRKYIGGVLPATDENIDLVIKNGIAIGQRLEPIDWDYDDEFIVKLESLQGNLIAKGTSNCNKDSSAPFRSVAFRAERCRVFLSVYSEGDDIAMIWFNLDLKTGEIYDVKAKYGLYTSPLSLYWKNTPEWVTEMLEGWRDGTLEEGEIYLNRNIASADSPPVFKSNPIGGGFIFSRSQTDSDSKYLFSSSKMKSYIKSTGATEIYQVPLLAKKDTLKSISTADKKYVELPTSIWKYIKQGFKVEKKLSEVTISVKTELNNLAPLMEEGVLIMEDKKFFD